MFAFNFLKNLPEDIISDVSYFLCDISEKALSNAEKNLKKFNVHTVLCDASDSPDFIKSANYIRINELYDDLPSKIFINEKGPEEVFFNEKLERKTIPAENKFIGKMPEGYLIPMNFTAVYHFEKCKEKLTEGGYIDVFDYGFSSKKEITEHPEEEWNNSVIRKFKGQITVDVNFMLFNGKTEPQKDYAERILEKKLYYAELEQLDYLTEKEAKEKTSELIKHGYPRDFIESGIEEKDEYFHLMAKT